MKERRQIVELWNQQQAAEGGRTAGVLVTLVRMEGSSYRRPGARLLMLADGRVAGTISGGCLEAEVLRRALWLTRAGAVVERYAMSFDDTAEIPFGLGCGGTIDLLFEPLGTPEAEALMAALAGSLKAEEVTVVSYLPAEGRGLRRLIVDAQGDVIFASGGLGEAKIACGRDLRAGQEYEGRFVELLEAPQRLVLLGAGEDARPLVELGASLGWTVIVADGRAQLARPERFPGAEQVLVLEGADVEQRLQLRPADAIVLMTHSYEQDRQLLQTALRAEPSYLGLLGSRHRSSLLVSEAAAALGRSLEQCCEHLHAPVGLDLGGDGPEAVALAIASEVHAVRHGRSGQSARLTPAEIAFQVEQGGSARYQQPCALNAVA